MRRIVIILLVNIALFGMTPFMSCGGENIKEAAPQEQSTGEQTASVEQVADATVIEPATEPAQQPDEAAPTDKKQPTLPEDPPSDLPEPNTPYKAPKGSQPPKDSFSFVAAQYQAKPTSDERQLCFVMEAPNKEDRLLHRFEPVIAQKGQVKAMVLSLEDGEKKAPWDCSDKGGFDDKTRPIFVWRPGTEAFQFPNKDGILLKAGVRLRLTILFHNTGQQPVDVKSGFKLFHVPTGGKTYILWFNPVKEFEVLADRSERKGSTCKWKEPVEMLAGSPLMGKMGRSFISELIRQDGTREELIFLDKWSPAEHWKIYSFPHKVSAGDKLLTTCSWRNTSKENVKRGWRTKDENCDLMVYITTPRSSKLCEIESTNIYIPPSINYKPGACGPKDGFKQAPDVKIKTALGSLKSDFGFKGGTWPEAAWRLESGEVTFNSPLLGNLLKKEYTTAAGQIKTGKTMHFDLVVQAVIEYGGRKIPYKLPLSIAGTFNKGSKPGSFSLTLTCGKLAYSNWTYQIDGNTLQLGGVINLTTQFGKLDYSMKLSFSKKLY